MRGKTSKDSEYATYGEYGNVHYEMVSGQTQKDDQNETVYTSKEKLSKKAVSKTLTQPSMLLKLLIAGFIVITIPCFFATFNFISQLREDIAALQMRKTSSQDGTFSTTVRPPLALPVIENRNLISDDEKVTNTLKLLEEGDQQIQEGIGALSTQFEELRVQIAKANSKVTEKIEKGACRLDLLLELWAVPTNSIGLLLTTEGWEEAAEGLYYQFWGNSEEDMKTYADSRIECNKLGGRLASKSLRHIGVFRRELWFSWIGYDDIDSEGLWVWSDGTKNLYPGKIEWYPSQPDNIVGEDCALIGQIVDKKILISDAPCDNTNPYICEIEVSRNKACPKH